MAKERAEQTELLILEGLVDFLKVAKPARESYYFTHALLEHLKGIDDLAWLNDSRQVIRELERTTIIQNKSRDMTRLRNGTGKQARAIRLDPVRIREIAMRYGVAVGEETKGG